MTVVHSSTAMFILISFLCFFFLYLFINFSDLFFALVFLNLSFDMLDFFYRIQRSQDLLRFKVQYADPKYPKIQKSKVQISKIQISKISDPKIQDQKIQDPNIQETKIQISDPHHEDLKF